MVSAFLVASFQRVFDISSDPFRNLFGSELRVLDAQLCSDVMGTMSDEVKQNES